MTFGTVSDYCGNALKYGVTEAVCHSDRTLMPDTQGLLNKTVILSALQEHATHVIGDGYCLRYFDLRHLEATTRASKKKFTVGSTSFYIPLLIFNHQFTTYEVLACD